MSGRLIRLFLVDGNPGGLRTVEISNMTIYATIFPRAKLKEFLQRDESKKAGCYILLGNDIETPEDIIAYVGESEIVADRIRSHAFGNKQKEFWNEAIILTSKDDYITKTQIKYLESEICRLATEAGKVRLDNDKQPSKPNLSEVDNAEMKHFLSAIQLILSSLGIDILESKRIKKDTITQKQERIYNFSPKGARASMKIDDDKYIVLKGSLAVIENRLSIGRSVKRMRQKLIKENIIHLTKNRDFYIFQDDYIFSSPSYAAAAVSGGEENGRIQWKYDY